MTKTMNRRAGRGAPAAALAALLTLACWACTPGGSDTPGASADAGGFQVDADFVLDGDASRAAAN